MSGGLHLYGPWILSILAVAQFWIWLMIRRVGGSNRLELYESGTVEVGYDANGPLIALAGVLRSADKEIFVRSMELTLTSEKDKGRHAFRWIAFKPNFLLPLAGSSAWEMPHPFMVTPGEPGKFNVVFHDVEEFPQVKAILQAYYHQWHEVEKRVVERRSLKPSEPDTSLHDDLIGEFKRTDVCVNSYNELNSKCYWEQGSYSLSLKVLTEGGVADLTRTFRFSLGKRDSKLLKTNCVTMLDEPIASLLGKPPTQCQAIQAEYVKAGQTP
jgi:hypothetical protein